MQTVPFPGRVLRPDQPRVTPGTRAEIGALNALICAALARAARSGAPPHVFTTLARHRRLFRAWLRFAGRLMPFGKLPRAESELVILRVAALCGSDYEWRQHVIIGQREGLTPEDVARAGEGPEAAGWTPRRQAILRAADELVRERTLSDASWSALRSHLSETEALELCLLAGHYAMLAGALNALGVQPETA